ncbi:hypothetical protein C8F04DRAFT_977493 [Mycena alexandri]|uniref:Uncharacterized protein n=1 Tax=Mycena alexandri TaxID=1745969 RepID=A0AAD6RZ89_9AGAR|nr:hypothetical protein C8F04DRAFT_977493 [Mycena alexandri]
MTQYLASVQSMPKETEEYLDKRIKLFVWEGRKKAPINHEILYLPVEEGGKNLLSIKDRNAALAVKTIQKFLMKGEDHAKWCDLAADSLRKDVPDKPKVEKSARMNPFIQTWAPLQKKLPKPLKRMMKTASKFRVKFDALALAKDVKEELLIWFHTGGKKDLGRHNNSACATPAKPN